MPWWFLVLGVPAVVSQFEILGALILILLVVLFIFSTYSIIFRAAQPRDFVFGIYLLVFAAGVAILLTISMSDSVGLIGFLSMLVAGGVWRGYQMIKLPESHPKRALYESNDKVEDVQARIIGISRGHSESDPGMVSHGNEDFDAASLAGRGMGPQARSKRLNHKSQSASTSLVGSIAKGMIGEAIVAAKSEPTEYIAELNESDIRHSFPTVPKSKISIEENPIIRFDSSEVSKPLSEGETIRVDLNLTLNSQGKISVHSLKDIKEI